MSSLFKVVNIGGKSVEVRLVKKTGAAQHFAGDIKPHGCVDDATELTFKLGGNTPSSQYEHVIIAHASTPNLVNPQNYVTNGNEYRLVKDETNSVITLHADLALSVQDPNYAQKQIGVFFRVKSSEAEYVMSTPTGSFNVRNNLNDSIANFETLRASKGVYFTDEDYYIPLYLGTPSQIIGVWAAQEYGVDPVYGNRISHVKSAVELVRFVPVESIAITNTDLKAKRNTTVDITTSLNPIDATIKSLMFSTSNTARGIFLDPAKPTLTYKGVGAFDVSVMATDNLGNEVTTTRGAEGLIDTTPYTFKVTPTAQNSSFAFTVQGAAGASSSVDWGDGNLTQTSNATPLEYNHTYAVPGNYTVKVYTDGTVNSITFSNELQYRELLTEVVDWGAGLVSAFNLGEPKLLTKVPATVPPHATTLSQLFKGAISFNVDISNWDVSKVTSLAGMFDGASAFNQPIGKWNVSKVKDFTNMFKNASSFNQPLETWVMVQATSLSGMFQNATLFDQPLNGWNVSNVLTMDNMFHNAGSFSHDLNSWNTAKVTNMSRTFALTPRFNGSIIGWDTGAVTNMSGMFESTSTVKSLFNRDISNWDVSSVVDMSGMFANTLYFNQNLRWWCVGDIPNVPADFSSTIFTSDNHPRWGMCPIRTATATIIGGDAGVIAGQAVTFTSKVTPTMPIQSTVWTSSNTAVIAIDEFTGEAFAIANGVANITVTINGLYTASKLVTVAEALIPLTLKTTGKMAIGDDIAMLMASGTTYSINWGDGNTETVEDYANHKYTTDGPHVITILPVGNGEIESLNVNGEISEVLDWYGGVTKHVAFSNPSNGGGSKLTTVPATAPNGLTSTVGMFRNCRLFNQDISLWNVSSVTDMTSMFENAVTFNQSLNSWDVSNVTSMTSMFRGATAFNGDISLWNVSSVYDMDGLLQNAPDFSHDLSMWCVPLFNESPYNFHSNLEKLPLDKQPVWGTCPNRNLVATIVADKTTIGAGLKTRLSYTTSPEITVTDEKWSVEDTSIMSVSTRGLVTAKAIGSTLVHLTLNKSYKTSLRLSVTALDFDDSTMVLTIKPTTGSYLHAANLSDTDPLLIDMGDGETKELLAGEVIRYEYTTTDLAYVQIASSGEPLQIELGGDYESVLQWASVGYDSLILSSTEHPATRLLDVPTLEPQGLTSYKGMFAGATTFNDDLSRWNTSQITDMSDMFRGVSTFNGDISSWDVSNVTDLSNMFTEATSFNQPIGTWDVSSVVSMKGLFQSASNFNQPLADWDVSSVTNMDNMFLSAFSFGQYLRLWCVANITSMPANFTGTAPSFTPDLHPIWGTCPIEGTTVQLSTITDMVVGDTGQLIYVINPQQTVTSVDWSVDIPEYASIDQEGNLTALAEGVVTVTVLINKLHSASVVIPIKPEFIMIAPQDLTATVIVI